MAKNVKILENSTTKYLANVAKIQTHLANGQKCLWIPEEDVPLGVLNVSEDGVYKAAEDANGPYYGYSKVVVEGVGQIVMGNLAEITVEGNGTYEAELEAGGPYLGYSKVVVNVTKDTSSHKTSGTVGKDQDGDDAIATVNPETGDIEIHKLDQFTPSSIKIVTPPTFTGPYGDGAYIGYDGMVVMACDENGDAMYEIPLDELIFPMSIARYDPEAAEEKWTSTLDGVGSLDYVVSSYFYIPGASHGTDDYALDLNKECRAYNYNNFIRLILDEPFSGYLRNITKNTILEGAYSSGWGKTTTSRIDVYGGHVGNIGWFWDVCVPHLPTNDNTYSYQEVIDIMYDGVSEESGGVIVPVQWPRPGDGAVLETSFRIIVVDVSPHGTND